MPERRLGIELAGDRRVGRPTRGKNSVLKSIGDMAPLVLVRLGFRDVEGRLRIPIHPVHRLDELWAAPRSKHIAGPPSRCWRRYPSTARSLVSISLVTHGRAVKPSPLRMSKAVFSSYWDRLVACWIPNYHDTHALIARLKQSRAQGRPAMVNQARVLRRYLFEDEYLPAIVHLQDYTPRITAKVLAYEQGLATQWFKIIDAMEAGAKHACIDSRPGWVRAILGPNIPLDPGSRSGSWRAGRNKAARRQAVVDRRPGA